MMSQVSFGDDDNTQRAVPQQNVRHRIEPLEFIRGFAAFIVVFWHTTLAFFPVKSGIFPNLNQSKALNGSPLYALISGEASVVLFFVLSGYVLTYSLYSTGSPSTLVRTAQKRLPRLAFLTTVVCVLSWLLFATGSYHFIEAGAASRSPWLAAFGYATEIPSERSLFDAVMQGASWTFLRGDSYFDSSLWTMKSELIGSYMSFGLALLTFNMRSIAWRYFIFVLLILYLLVSNNDYMICFVAGVMLAEAKSRTNLDISMKILAPLLLLAAYLYGYSGVKAGVFKPIFRALHNPDRIHIWTLSAVIIIGACLFSGTISRALSGPVARFLGWISFPLYLIHVPVICSLGSLAYLGALRFTSGHSAAVIAAIVVVPVSVLCAIVLAKLNDRWMRELNKMPLGEAPEPARAASTPTGP